MKHAALILVAIVGAFAVGLVPVGKPLVETTYAVRILEYRVTLGLHVGVERAEPARPDSAFVTAPADSVGGPVR